MDKRSRELRFKVLNTVNAVRRGHVGSAFSSMDIVRVLYDHFLRFNPQNPNWEERDRFVFSKGHGCLSLYTLLAEKGFFPEKDLYTFCKFGSRLGGHPQYGKVPGVEASTGSLGHGLSMGLGMAVALRIKNAGPATRQPHRHPRGDPGVGAPRLVSPAFSLPRVFVLLSDGECNEGSTWEAILAASKHKLDNLLILVDYNKMQSYGKTYEVLDLEPFRAKWEGFGFRVEEVNGHHVPSIRSAIKKYLKLKGPRVIICHTIKGKGVPFIEQNPSWHHKHMITDEEMERLYRELVHY
ncbi:transketolase [Candidatus Gottesmanbacteria bacterium]|nr:transketolase [Candidatus Gottesmanbacteria bacterium]